MHIKNLITNQKIIRTLILLMIVLNVFLILYLVFGFGTLRISATADGTRVFIDENLIDSSTKELRLRPGTYTVRYAGKSDSPEPQTVRVSLFKTTVSAPDPANPINILVNSRLAPQSAGKITVKESWYSSDGNWMIASYAIGESEKPLVVAIRFIETSWQTIATYPGSSNEPFDQITSKLPTDIAVKFKEMAMRYEID